MRERCISLGHRDGRGEERGDLHTWPSRDGAAFAQLADRREFRRVSSPAPSRYRLLDIGAGPGTITADFADSVAQVTATEVGQRELDLSRATIAERGLGNVDFSVQDVHHLTFEDSSFDVTHAQQALREMGRVTRAGGLVAARDGDYAGFAWWPRLSELDEWLRLQQAAARANGGEPDAGRRLLSWARAAGL